MKGALTKFFKFEVADSSLGIGKGIVCTKMIENDEIICKMTGPSMNLMNFFEKYDSDGCNVLQVNEDKFLDVIEPFVFFNHSCDPNAGIRNNGVLFALKKILPGEEIFFDYSTTVDDCIWSMNCKCRSKNCRSIIADFQTISHAQKQYYLSRGALLRHIIDIYY